MDHSTPLPAASTADRTASAGRAWVLRALAAVGLAIVVLVGWSGSSSASDQPTAPVAPTAPATRAVGGVVDTLVGPEGLLTPVLDAVAPAPSAPRSAAPAVAVGGTAVVPPATPTVVASVRAVGDAVEPVLAPVAPMVATLAPVVRPVVEAAAPVVAPLAPVTAPALEALAPVVAPIATPVAQAVAPVVAPLTPTVEAVSAEVVAPIATALAPITALAGPLTDTARATLASRLPADGGGSLDARPATTTGSLAAGTPETDRPARSARLTAPATTSIPAAAAIAGTAAAASHGPAPAAPVRHTSLPASCGTPNSTTSAPAHLAVDVVALPLASHQAVTLLATHQGGPRHHPRSEPDVAPD